LKDFDRKEGRRTINSSVGIEFPNFFIGHIVFSKNQLKILSMMTKKKEKRILSLKTEFFLKINQR